MKKPLILLVDDDRAVMAALEAALVPAFEEIACVEAFDKPEDVLAAVPRWAEEKRPIAVAIVDQKMPGMTGVELLTQLRGEIPAAHMQSILLTGYAGLDSALAAKNEAGVERYLQKPWIDRELITEVGGCLASSLGAAGSIRYDLLRVLTEADEIVAAFRLRYAVYRAATFGQSFVDPNDDQAAVDAFDPRSVIFGLFRREQSRAEQSRMIGTMRLSIDGPSPQREAIMDAASRLPTQGEVVTRESSSRFPLERYFHDPVPLGTFLDDLVASGARIGEVGRHAIIPEARSGGTDRRQIEALASCFFSLALTHAIAGIPSLHQRHYRPLGFVKINELREPGVGFAALTIILASLEAVPSPVRERVIGMSRAETRHGGTPSLCLCGSWPECLPDRYDHGPFHDVDVFCPKAASGRLQELSR